MSVCALSRLACRAADPPEHRAARARTGKARGGSTRSSPRRPCGRWSTRPGPVAPARGLPSARGSPRETASREAGGCAPRRRARHSRSDPCIERTHTTRPGSDRNGRVREGGRAHDTTRLGSQMARSAREGARVQCTQLVKGQLVQPPHHARERVRLMVATEEGLFDRVGGRGAVVRFPCDHGDELVAHVLKCLPMVREPAPNTADHLALAVSELPHDVEAHAALWRSTNRARQNRMWIDENERACPGVEATDRRLRMPASRPIHHLAR